MVTKESRKELLKGPDEFMTLSERAAAFVRDHSRGFSYGGAALAAALLVYLGISWYLGYEDRRGQELYNKAYYALRTAEASNVDPDPSARPADLFADLMDGHGLAHVSDLALPQLARLKFEAGEVDEAIRLYRSFQSEIDPESRYAAMAHLAVAGCLEAKQDYGAAVEELRPLAEGSGSVFQEQALVHLVRLHLLQGRRDQAAETRDRLSREYPGSPFIPFAEGIFY